MGTIPQATSPSALSILTGPDGPLSSLYSPVPQSVLQSASPTDLASLSAAALGLEEVNGLFGDTSPSEYVPQPFDLSILSAVYGLPPPSSATAATEPLQALLPALYGLTPASPAATTPAATTGTLVNTVG